jgi:hypothetical protein
VVVLEAQLAHHLQTLVVMAQLHQSLVQVFQLQLSAVAVEVFKVAQQRVAVAVAVVKVLVVSAVQVQ